MKNSKYREDKKTILLFFYLVLFLSVFITGLFSIFIVKIGSNILFFIFVLLIAQSLLKKIKILFSIFIFLALICLMQIFGYYFITGIFTLTSINYQIILNIFLSILFSIVIVHYVKKIPFSLQPIALIFTLQKRIMNELSTIPKKELIQIPKVLSLLIISAFDEYCIIKKRINSIISKHKANTI